MNFGYLLCGSTHQQIVKFSVNISLDTVHLADDDLSATQRSCLDKDFVTVIGAQCQPCGFGRLDRYTVGKFKGIGKIVGLGIRIDLVKVVGADILFQDTGQEGFITMHTIKSCKISPFLSHLDI